jgi:hypothetical protein
VDDETRESLIALCAERLAPDGLLYINYNARPGWDVRALVRRHLLESTESGQGLRARAEQAIEVAGGVLAALAESPHPYRQLMLNEYRIVAEADLTYVAHEYLAPHNRAFWRSEFASMMRCAGLEIVADADFNFPSGRLDPGLADRLRSEGIAGAKPDDTLDLLSYRQLHSPILAKASTVCRPIQTREIADLTMASCLAPRAREGPAWPTFVHPSGYEVEAKDASMAEALRVLQLSWPNGQRVDQLFPDVPGVFDDLALLYRNGLVDLRLDSTPDDVAVDAPRLNHLERRWGGYSTGARHACERCDVGN